ncbi:MAG TPA: hypothetical protein VGM26_08760 [Rhizomicrobium sp.]|jgi:hypothetical protein
MAKARRREREDRYDGDLCAGHLLVWTWRKFVSGHADCPLLAREYFSFAGERADELLTAFAAFLQTLGHGSRRILAVGHPHCAGITPDEGQILRLIAAAQSDDTVLLTTHLRWLVKSEHQPATQRAVNHLVANLSACGVMLPAVAIAPPPGAAMLEVVRRECAK